jgi:hypothetical protein
MGFGTVMLQTIDLYLGTVTPNLQINGEQLNKNDTHEPHK